MLKWAMFIAANWKGALGSIAAVLIVLLQIVQVLMSSEIDTTLAQKTVELRAKADSINTMLQTHSQQTAGNTKRIDAVLQQITALQGELKDLEDEEKKK